ncbi:MAG: transglycosylase SLT domain-containing protein [Gemmatimonadetes bacterium]|nr:transglycosylase SLT domain-containing protein [Gemmatimonadota bacterium]
MRRRHLMFGLAFTFWSPVVPATAQTDRLVNPGSSWAGPWHAAVGLADRLGDSTGPADVLEAAESEIALGRPMQAIAILSAYALPDSLFDGAPLALRAAALYLLGEYEEAGELFDGAAVFATGLRQGILLTRAAEASEQAGLRELAAERYRIAASAVPAARGWLAIRRARLTDDIAQAFELLRVVPEAGTALAGEVRVFMLAAAGDTAGAVEAMVALGRPGDAGILAFAAGDRIAARRLVYRAIEMRDEDQALQGVAAAVEHFPATNIEEHLAIARAVSRYGRAADALPHVAAAVVAGDSSVETLLFYGQTMETSGNRPDALEVYAVAAAGVGDQVGEASYRWARTLLRLRHREAAFAALGEFLTERPDHDRAAAALFLMADLRQDQGRVRESDSLFRLLNGRWPASEFASTARSRLAGRALARQDTERALELFRLEMENDGSRSRFAQFQLARLTLESGDTAAAREQWIDLAERDSIGYYGTIAREAAGMPPAVFAVPPPHTSSPEVIHQLEVLDLLEASSLEAEATALVAHLSDRDRWEVTDLLDVAEGLIARGRAREAVGIGWVVAGLHQLNDPRVLRVIFPWPNRALVEREAHEFDLDPYLMAAMIRQESVFDPDATSRAGARGMMQLMPATARGLARQLRLDWDNTFLGVADANLHLGAAHLAAMLRQYDGELVPALAAYNAGASRVRRWLRYPEARDWVLFIERIPFPETRGYVQTLLRNRAVYSALYSEPPVP